MIETLRQFKAQESLFDAASALLEKLGIKFNAETTSPIPVSALYNGPMPQYLTDALQFIDYTYFIGVANDLSLQGQHESKSLEEVAETFERGGRYDGMFIFACDAKPGANLTRTAAAALTRAFNRLASANPVILVIRQENLLSLATCEHMEYTQQWRQGTGEKIGKVSILRNINCDHPHRGHLDILQQLVSDSCDTFEKLYKHWMKVFNSELLTQNFYNDLFNWYQWAVHPESKVTFPNDPTIQEDDREDIDTKVIRLITRLMFVWFIKQKGLVPSEIFDENFVASILKDFDSQSTTSGTYYNAIIQNLFFGTLNRPIIEDGEVRGFAESNEQDCKNLYRYEELFSISKQEVIDMFATVPFLNCGLFECQDKNATFDGVERRFYNDGFSRNAAKFKDGTYKYRAVVPNILFFEPTRGLLSIFNKYVFTIEENTPQDVQVALDPELLGKVFENLLGAYNPETQETARNQSGSFYTPREIVQYMVNESLVAHLKRTVGDELEPQYRQLMDFSEMHVELSEKQKHDILHSLFTCKILDPACGSGAFPMGMLQQMVHILRQVDPDNTQWKDVLLNMAVDESRRAFGIDNEEERQKKLLEIERTFDENLKSPDYTRKLYIIESCIYGVDIQPIAMLITRLRFFISLICEQTDIRRDDPEHNFGIKTLPNLESKFVAANTLIDADIHKYNEDWTANPVLMQLKNELLAIRRRHFYTRKRSEKIRLRKQDNVMREKIHQCITKLVGEPDEGRIALFMDIKAKAEAELTQYLEENWVEETQAVQASLFDENPQTQIVTVDKNKPKRLELQQRIKKCDEDIQREHNKTIPSGFEAAVLEVTKWNPYDQNSVSPFFDLEWMFGITDGFDIVIGNPPYIQLQADRGKLANLYETCGYETFLRNGDIYCLFYERGWQLLKDGGLLNYITSNKWMRAGYGQGLRQFLTSRTSPQLLIDFNETHVFESACVMTNILAFRRAENDHKLMAAQVQEDFNDPSIIGPYFTEHAINCRFESDESWVIKSDFERALKRKVEAQGTPLEEWSIEIFRGILTGYNPAFFVTTEQRDAILDNCADEDERNRTEALIRKMLRGKDIHKYGYHWADMWLIWVPWHFPYHLDSSIEGASTSAELAFMKSYPALYHYLESFKEKLSSRNKAETGIRYEWYALQRWGAKYWKNFYLPKIIYPNMTKFMPFVYDEEGVLTNQKCFILSGNHISYLTALFNSSLFKYCFFDNFPVLFGGSRELSKIFFDKIPVKEVSDEVDAEFRELVLDIQREYSDDKAKAIDQKIFDLYGLTPEEREAIGYIDFNN